VPRRAVGLHAENYYHLYNRGVNRERTFFEPENYSYLLRRLRKYLASDAVQVAAYCLTPNHYHLLLLVQAEGSDEEWAHSSYREYKALREDSWLRTEAIFPQGASVLSERTGVSEHRAYREFVDSYLEDLPIAHLLFEDAGTMGAAKHDGRMGRPRG
jgi:REP element-mobilizing transposase RayT